MCYSSSLWDIVDSQHVSQHVQQWQADSIVKETMSGYFYQKCLIFKHRNESFQNMHWKFIYLPYASNINHIQHVILDRVSSQSVPKRKFLFANKELNMPIQSNSILS